MTFGEIRKGRPVSRATCVGLAATCQLRVIGVVFCNRSTFALALAARRTTLSSRALIIVSFLGPRDPDGVFGRDRIDEWARIRISALESETARVMPLAVRQHADLPNADEWVSVDRAAELTGESVWTWRRRAKAQLRHDRPLAIKRAVGRGRPAWYVHRSMHDALTRFPHQNTREEQAREALQARHASHQVSHAYRKAHWLRKWRTRIEHGRLTERQAAQRIIEEARQVDGETFKISSRKRRVISSTDA